MFLPKIDQKNCTEIALPPHPHGICMCMLSNANRPGWRGLGVGGGLGVLRKLSALFSRVGRWWTVDDITPKCRTKMFHINCFLNIQMFLRQFTKVCKLFSAERFTNCVPKYPWTFLKIENQDSCTRRAHGIKSYRLPRFQSFPLGSSWQGFVRQCCEGTRISAAVGTRGVGCKISSALKQNNNIKGQLTHYRHENSHKGRMQGLQRAWESHNRCLQAANLKTLSKRREDLCKSFLTKIGSQPP